MATMQPTVIAQMTRSILDCADELGLPRAKLLAASGLSQSMLQTPETRITYERYFALWQAIDRDGGPEFGLHLGESIATARSYGIAGYLLMNYDTLGQVLHGVMQYGSLLNENALQRFYVTKNTVTIVDGPLFGPQWPRAYAATVAITYLQLSRTWTGEQFTAQAVELPYAPPDDQRPYTELFDAPVYFGRPRLAIHLDRAILDLPIIKADPQLRVHLEERVKMLVSRLPQAALPARVTAIIEDELPHRAPCVARAAQGLGMSARTLQRRLADNGTSFSAVADLARRHRALWLLDDPTLNIAECAHQCGFSNTPAFRRAFRRWTGITPGAFRNKN